MSISAKITAFFIARSIIPSTDREIYEYGFELLIADLINFSAILLIGGLAGQLWYSILYLLIFVGLRSFCGGYHAKTHLRCHICTIGAYLVFIVCNMCLSPQNALLLLGENLLASVPVVLFAPIPHANKPLTEAVRKKNRIRSIVLYFCLTLLAFVLCLHNRQEGAAISLTLWIISLCMIPAIYIYSQKGRKTS
ncbi:accessory gene regulator B family protein [Butyricicoccus faecihominis]|uniref:accessory gene regulator ArgB-like protein n=1 Tax=Butyricicoccus faecihominis TaxID=1712515 RepID=UPI002478EB2C|nr:accessory gene regulator B family protein [Butyricicoccus faecihominis]MCQ5128591.1 accessory gene regulator B family protein [Butyricicoccus faecihominis]